MKNIFISVSVVSEGPQGQIPVGLTFDQKKTVWVLLGIHSNLFIVMKKKKKKGTTYPNHCISFGV